MNRGCLLLTLAMLAAAVAPAGRAASAEKPEPAPVQKPDAKNVVTSEEAPPVYRPPLRGAPGGRVGGSTRGPGQPLFLVSVLAPDHTGLTASEHPSLYWYVSGTANAPVEVTVTAPRAIKPLLQLQLPAPVAAGIHRIRLQEHGVRLQPGIAYRWYVAVVTNANRRSKDVLAGGTIERIELADELRSALAKAGPAHSAALLAQAGYWYDAVASISELIEAAPHDPGLKAPRAALLAQVGLTQIKD